MSTRIGWLSCLCLLVIASFASAQEKRPAKPMPEKSSLEATLVANEDTYTIPEGQRGKDFADSLKRTTPDRPAPKPPEVDLTFKLKNPTKMPIVIVVGSDAGALDLKLEGPGAVTADGQQIFTREFRGGKKVEIKPGEAYEIPIKSLQFGFRGVAQHAYWTEPGKYKIIATLRWPDPTDDSGRKLHQAASEPVELTVK